jgi:haloalkane dehalogenase
MTISPYRAYGARQLPIVVLVLALAACAESVPESVPDPDFAMDEIPSLRTPDERFVDLPDFPFAPHYAQVPGGLRMHYLDEGPAGASVVVLLHGEPSWSFLYRKMIPVLTEAGHRVIAPDLIGFGRSDKPLARTDHTYERHVEWVRSLLFDHLDLTDVTLFAQDWGGLIGLRVVAENPDRFARVAIGNTGLPTGDQAMPEAFREWLAMSQEAPVFASGRIVQGGTVSRLPPEVVAAYEAPFPDSTYKAGARVMPALVPITPDDPASEANRAAWAVLMEWRKPFLTLFSDRDPVTGGLDEAFRTRVPGAEGQPHHTITDAGHFLQEDKGEELAERLVRFIRAPTSTRPSGT